MTFPSHRRIRASRRCKASPTMQSLTTAAFPCSTNISTGEVLTANVSYTYSHSLDDISNGGNSQLPYNGNTSVPLQITPDMPSRLMYSNSDYDIRNNFLVDLVYVEPNRFGNQIRNAVGAGWTVGSKAYWRSGQPFSVFNSMQRARLGSNGTGGASTVLAQVLNNNFNHKCNSYSNPCFQTAGIFNGQGLTVDPDSGNVVPVGPGPSPQTNYGNVPRNAFYGPHYADVDLNLYKDVYKHESMTFQIGAQAYNALNHVNFAAPQINASNLSTLGAFLRMSITHQPLWVNPGADGRWPCTRGAGTLPLLKRRQKGWRRKAGLASESIRGEAAFANHSSFSACEPWFRLLPAVPLSKQLQCPFPGRKRCG